MPQPHIDGATADNRTVVAHLYMLAAQTGINWSMSKCIRVIRRYYSRGINTRLTIGEYVASLVDTDQVLAVSLELGHTRATLTAALCYRDPTGVEAAIRADRAREAGMRKALRRMEKQLNTSHN